MGSAPLRKCTWEVGPHFFRVEGQEPEATATSEPSFQASQSLPPNRAATRLRQDVGGVRGHQAQRVGVGQVQNGLLRFPFQREGAPESYNFHGQDHWLPAGQGRGMLAVSGRRTVWFRDCGSIQRPSDFLSERFASVQLCGIKSIRSYFVQPSPPSFSRTFPASQTATLPPLDTDAPSVSPQHPLPPAVPTVPLPVSLHLSTLGTS